MEAKISERMLPKNPLENPEESTKKLPQCSLFQTRPVLGDAPVDSTMAQINLRVYPLFKSFWG